MRVEDGVVVAVHVSGDEADGVWNSEEDGRLCFMWMPWAWLIPKHHQSHTTFDRVVKLIASVIQNGTNTASAASLHILLSNKKTYTEKFQSLEWKELKISKMWGKSN